MEVGNAVHISVYSLFGSQTYNTMKLKGYIKKQLITVLIDTAHNFVDINMIKFLDCCVQETEPLWVSVAYGV